MGVASAPRHRGGCTRPWTKGASRPSGWGDTQAGTSSDSHSQASSNTWSSSGARSAFSHHTFPRCSSGTATFTDPVLLPLADARPASVPSGANTLSRTLSLPPPPRAKAVKRRAARGTKKCRRSAWPMTCRGRRCEASTASHAWGSSAVTTAEFELVLTLTGTTPRCSARRVRTPLSGPPACRGRTISLGPSARGPWARISAA